MPQNTEHLRLRAEQIAEERGQKKPTVKSKAGNGLPTLFPDEVVKRLIAKVNKALNDADRNAGG